MVNKGLDKRIVFALLIASLVLMAGFAGYMIIERYGLLDALYMTVITIGTLGYGEVRPLSPEGKVFTIFLIVMGLLAFTFALSFFTSYLVEIRLTHFLKGRKKETDLKKIKDHVIVCGYGRNGKQAAAELNLSKKPVVIVEKQGGLILSGGNESMMFVEGDAREDAVLEVAGIRHAAAIITTLPNDADNLYVVLTARSLNNKIRIISRASCDAGERRLRIAGADHVVMPEQHGGSHMANLVARPDLAEFMYQLSIRGEQGVNLLEVICSELPEEIKDKTIHDLRIPGLTGAKIVGFKSPSSEFIINPPPDTLIHRNAKLFVLGMPEQIEMMKSVIKLGKRDLS